jgi:hypothetical protein
MILIELSIEGKKGLVSNSVFATLATFCSVDHIKIKAMELIRTIAEQETSY